MQREHIRTQSGTGGQRQRISVGSHAESHARTGDEEDWQRALIRNVRYSRLLPTSCYRKAGGMMTVVKGTIVDDVTVGAVPIPEGNRTPYAGLAASQRKGS